MNIHKLPLVLLALALMGAGTDAEAQRTRKFSCPLPDKRACMSTEEVYRATSFEQDLEQFEKVQPVTRQVQASVMGPRPAEQVGGVPVEGPNRCCSPVKTEVTVKGDTLAVASPTYGAVTVPGVQTVSYATGAPRREDMVVRTTRNEPFRVPAKVMRIFISPWEDEQGDLHMGGYVFSEVAARKWSVGTRAVNTDNQLRLLTLNSPVRDAAQDAKTDKGEATAQVNRTE